MSDLFKPGEVEAHERNRRILAWAEHLDRVREARDAAARAKRNARAAARRAAHPKPPPSAEDRKRLRENAQRRSRERDARGLCSVAGCYKDKALRRKRCPEHLRIQRDLSRVLREQRLAAGRCIRCDETPPLDGRKLCARCGQLQREAGNARRAERRAAGRCTKCNDPVGPARMALCPRCRFRDNSHRRATRFAASILRRSQ